MQSHLYLSFFDYILENTFPFLTIFIYQLSFCIFYEMTPSKHSNVLGIKTDLWEKKVIVP